MTDEIIAEPEAPLYTVEEFGGSRRLYPAELTFEPPRHGGKSALQPCGATYGLLIAHGFIKLTCALQRHDRPRKMDGRDVPDNSWHVAPLLDGNFRWPPGATGAPEEK